MKSFFFILASTFVISCSSSDDNSVIQTNQGVVKIEVTTQNNTNPNVYLNIQVVGDDILNTHLSGSNWDDVQTIDGHAKWFLLNNDVLHNSISYETSNDVMSVTYAAVIVPDENSTNEIQGTVKFFVNGSLQKTETFTVSNEQVNLSIPFVVGAN